MRTTIVAPYTDTRASGLCWRLDLSPQPALGSLTVELAAGAVELRVLGASHQVIATLPAVADRRDAAVSEFVGCTQAGETLPAEARRALGGLRYRFRAAVEELAPQALAAAANRLIAELADHPCGLVGIYPGAPGAVTALVAQPCAEGVRWRSWHCYPQTGEVVTTTTTVHWT